MRGCCVGHDAPDSRLGWFGQKANLLSLFISCQMRSFVVVVAGLTLILMSPFLSPELPCDPLPKYLGWSPIKLPVVRFSKAAMLTLSDVILIDCAVP